MHNRNIADAMLTFLAYLQTLYNVQYCDINTVD